MKKNKYSHLVYSFLLSIILLFGCTHPSAGGSSIDSTQTKNNILAAVYHRGASTEKDLANALFLHLQGEISFDSLRRFIPNEKELKAENIFLKKDSSSKVVDAESLANANAIKAAIAAAQQRAQTVGISLPDANLDDVRSEVSENNSENLKKLTLLGSQNYKNFKIYTHIVKIGDYWYLDKSVVFETAN
jgi:hypothetical protein